MNISIGSIFTSFLFESFSVHVFLHCPCFSWKECSNQTKPFFCLGNRNECHATTKLQNKTSMKHSWKFLKFSWNSLDTFVALPLTPLEIPRNTIWTSNVSDITESPLKVFQNTLQFSLKHCWKFLETSYKKPLTIPSNTLWAPFKYTRNPLIAFTLSWNTLETSLKHS